MLAQSNARSGESNGAIIQQLRYTVTDVNLSGASFRLQKSEFSPAGALQLVYTICRENGRGLAQFHLLLSLTLSDS